MKKIPLAIAYDFDGTLAPGNMQERAFIPAIGMDTHAFWSECAELARKHEADNILVYMRLMLEKAAAKEISVRKEDFADYGRRLKLFNGVEPGDGDSGWFARIDAYGASRGIVVEHYVISSGIREMVLGTAIAPVFKAVFASSYWYDHHGVPKWPALAVNYTTKTQYLFRINKGVPHVYEHKALNEFLPDEERPVPFTNIVFIGDGETDVPCFRLVKEQGGHSIAVHEPRKPEKKEIAEKLIRDGRVNFLAPADYRDGYDLDRLVRRIVDKIAADAALAEL